MEAVKDRYALTARVMRDVRDRAGGAKSLARKLADVGVLSDAGHPYSESGISNWVRARSAPPGDVLLAAAKLANISIDTYYLGTSAAGEVQTDEQIVRALRDEIAATNARVDALVESLDSLTKWLREARDERDERASTG